MPAQRAAMNATAVPAVTPMTNPPIASNSVAWAERNSGNRSLLQFSTSAARIADGAGRMNARIWSVRTSASHTMSAPTATSTAGK